MTIKEKVSQFIEEYRAEMIIIGVLFTVFIAGFLGGLLVD